MNTPLRLTSLRTLVAIFGAALLLSPACGTTNSGAGGTGKSSSKSSLPTFVATDLSGDDFDLSTHLGRDVVLISFWATYCEPCKTEMPVLQKMHDAYAAKGLKILSVSLDNADSMAGVKPYIKTNGYTFTVVIDEDTTIANAYNPRLTAPFTILIDRKGAIYKKIEGFQLSEAEHLENEVKSLLAKN